MKIENLSTLKINKLTQEQYDIALVNNKINENEFYFTPDDSELKIAQLTETINSLTEEVNKLKRIIDGGTLGQFATSDGKGGINWITLHNAEEVEY